MEFLIDPHAVAGLATLIVLELVLGIDNLVFVAILAGKLPPHQRDRARVIGLTLALAMRLALLSGASHVIEMTDPVVTLLGRGMSWRDIMLLGGGLFLLAKATKEIHARLEGDDPHGGGERRSPSFVVTIVQIVVLDAIFSADAIITAVGMVEQLWVMMAAVVISMAIMIKASRPLTEFVSKHPTVIILCLCFLLLIGCSLMAEGVGFHFPKTYLYAAIGFSLLIEALNQIGGRNRRKAYERIPLRTRTADAILRVMSAASPEEEEKPSGADAPAQTDEETGLEKEEQTMIRGVISLGDLPVRRIMTVRPDIALIAIRDDSTSIMTQLLESGRTRMLLCHTCLDDIIGVVEVNACLKLLLQGAGADLSAIARPAVFVHEVMTSLQLINLFRRRDERFAVVTDLDGTVEGVVTTTDIFAAIAGDLAEDEDEEDIRVLEQGRYEADGTARMADLTAKTGLDITVSDREYETVGGHVLHMAGRLPVEGDVFEEDGHRFTVLHLEGRRVSKVLVEECGEGGEEDQ